MLIADAERESQQEQHHKIHGCHAILNRFRLGLYRMMPHAPDKHALPDREAPAKVLHHALHAAGTLGRT